MDLLTKTSPDELAHQWAELKTNNPHLRIRNAAGLMGVSEEELLATRCGEDVIRLRPEFIPILTEVEKLGKVMALTRNDEVVHERKGIYLSPNFKAGPGMGLFVGEDIDLRIFFGSWASAYAVRESMPRGENEFRYSLQFFSKSGEAIHKIYLTPASDEEAYHTLVEAYRSPDQDRAITVGPAELKRPMLPDAQVDVEAFRQGWLELQDTHDFFMLLKKHRLDRIQALRLAPAGNYAVLVDNQALRAIVTKAAETETPIMVFVGNPGMIQIHTGPVKRLMDREDWFNVLDPDFNLHVKEPAIAQSWIVRKPTQDGLVTALECYNAAGDQIIQLFGKRKPGIPELASWREIIANVEMELKM